MDTEKKFQARLQQKHGTAEDWSKAVNFVPKAGEIIVYDADYKHTHPRIKVGDGITPIGELKFLTNTLIVEIEPAGEENIYRFANEEITFQTLLEAIPNVILVEREGEREIYYQFTINWEEFNQIDFFHISWGQAYDIEVYEDYIERFNKTYVTEEELGNIENALDAILVIQNQLIGGGG